MTVLAVLALHGTDWQTHRTLRINGASYTLVVAGDDAARAKGLSGQAFLPEHEGMLFVYGEPARRCFWMKDMRFALDILWVDAAKKIVHMERDVRPETYPHRFCPEVPAQYVIELPAGQDEKRSVRTGDTLSF